MQWKAVSALALWVVSVVRVSGQTVSLFGNTWTGDGTYYGDNQGYGTCSFSNSDAQYLPWASGTSFRVAMDSPFFFNSQTCGMCIAMRGTGPGSGGDPIPLTTQYVLVSNLCPECKEGDLDQEKAGDGRWKIEWYPVQCAVGSTPLVYSFQGSNPYYIKMQVSNHRVPVLSVQWFFSGTWYDMNRVGDNYFVIQAINDQALILPAQVKITSIFGDTVIDTVATSSPTGRVTGNVQFPDNPSLQTVPDPDAASPTPAVAPATEVTPAANPPAASPPSGPTPAAPVPDTPANPPPANPTPAAPVPAAEQPPAQTAPGADNGPASNGALWDAANAQSAHLTPEQAAKMAPYPKPPQSAGSPVILDPYAQCGGINNAPQPEQSGNFAWTSTVCPDTWTCLSNANPWYWQCLPIPYGFNTSSLSKTLPLVVSFAKALSAESSCTHYIMPYDQCGGTAGGCYGPQCADTVWKNACCAPNNKGEAFSCARSSALLWKCLPDSFVTTSSYSATVPKEAIGGSMGSPTVLAAKHGAKAQVSASFAASLAAKVPRKTAPVKSFVAATVMPTNLQSFRKVVPHGNSGLSLAASIDQTGVGAPVVAATPPASTDSNASSAPSDSAGSDSTSGSGALSIEDASPITNVTFGQATKYIIESITSKSAGANCLIWVSEGVQCGGKGGTCSGDSCMDVQWDGACCLHPLNRCQRFDENYWECRTGSTFVSAE